MAGLLFPCALSCTLIFAAPAAPPELPPILKALELELDRSIEGLKSRESEPLYFLSYRATESMTDAVSGNYGALELTSPSHSRRLDVEARVGSPKLDSTHQIRGRFEFGAAPSSIQLPLEDDEAAIRAAAWGATDRAYKAALERILRVKTNEQVKVEAEDTSDDFQVLGPSTYFEPTVSLVFDRPRWEERMRRLSALFREYPFLHGGGVSISGEAENRFYASSEGTRLVFGRTHFRITIEANTTADDGMELGLYDSFEAPEQDLLPADDVIEQAIRLLADRLGQLRVAPIVEPFAGPAIVMNRACGVFFHEIFGHRIEGHRQKDVDEGQTFTKKVATEIMPPFLSVSDDPTRRQFGSTYLNGFFRYDDEGVPAQAVNLVEQGVLKNFLMSRSPIAGFPASNGHGRCSAGYPVVSRQGNLIVSARDRVPFARLRELLLEEVQRQGKPYGLVFHDISGGFTTTSRQGPQAFKVIPLFVVRVYTDGRPDEVVRGVDLVGTPLASISKILAAADDDAVFNGSCGAESGWVPVSAIAPSVLVSEMEIEKKQKSQERPPLLAAPAAPAVSTAPDEGPALAALRAELARSTTELKMENVPPPYRLALTLSSSESFGCSASFGALLRQGADANRSVSIDLRVGDPSLDNTGFRRGGGTTASAGRVELPEDDDALAIQRRLWLAIDGGYKAAVEDLAAKQAWLQTNSVPDRPADLSPAEPVVLLGPMESFALDRPTWVDLARRLSGRFRSFPRIQTSLVSLDGGAGNETLISSEGFHTRDGYRFARLVTTGSTQAPDGMPLGDAIVHYGRDPGDLPDAARLEAEVDAMARRLEERAGAARAEEYIGPVLFEGDAACFVMLELLIDRLANPHEPLGAKNAGTPFKNRLKKRVTPDFLKITDDPTRSELDGVPLLGSYEVDDDGVRAQPVTLVDEGRLKSWYMSRIPTRAIAETNGHSVGGAGGPGVVLVESSKTLEQGRLRAELIRIAVEQELPYAIRVEAMARDDIRVAGARNGGQYSNGNVSLSQPIAAWRVYPDGREEPIRGGDWQGVTLRTLRDIAVTGDRPHVLNCFRNGAFLSVACPSLLIEELEMRKPAEQESKLPYLEHPSFAAR